MPTQGQEPAAAEPVSPSPEPATPQTVPQDQPPLAAAPEPSDPVVAIIRSKLADPTLRKGANPDDLAALEAFYGARGGGPLWMTDMGFSARGQAAIFEIAKADDWGLQASSFELPDAGALPASKEAEALAELKLDLAILKYARFARGGRFDPSSISKLFDQVPQLRDPKVVPRRDRDRATTDLYLQSLHPKHEQFERLRQALLKARGEARSAASP